MIDIKEHPNFGNFDVEDVYTRCQASILQAASGNFVVEFNSTDAVAARDVGKESMEKFLEAERPNNSTTRWINIWAPEQQRSLVKLLADRYGFSPRLVGIMCSEHNKRDFVPSTPRQSGLLFRGNRKQNLADRSSVETIADPEKHEKGVTMGFHEPTFNLNHYKVVNQVWHFSSVDWGEKCRRPVPITNPRHADYTRPLRGLQFSIRQAQRSCRWRQ